LNIDNRHEFDSFAGFPRSVPDSSLSHSGCSYGYCGPDLVNDFENAHHVFLARVANIKQVARVINTGDLVDVYFDIKKTWKGNLGSRPLRTINNDADMCSGPSFREGEIRLFFLDNRGNVVSCYPYLFKNEKEAADIAADLDRRILDWASQ
jgi:hypothetical protein